MRDRELHAVTPAVRTWPCRCSPLQHLVGQQSCQCQVFLWVASGVDSMGRIRYILGIFGKNLMYQLPLFLLHRTPYRCWASLSSCWTSECLMWSLVQRVCALFFTQTGWGEEVQWSFTNSPGRMWQWKLSRNQDFQCLLAESLCSQHTLKGLQHPEFLCLARATRKLNKAASIPT